MSYLRSLSLSRFISFLFVFSHNIPIFFHSIIMTSIVQDPHQGGDLSDIAVTDIAMPNDAGRMNTIPSVPRPDQAPDSENGITKVNARRSSLAAAASEPADIPRSFKDISATGKVETGTR
jgi:hypothetical protein